MARPTLTERIEVLNQRFEEFLRVNIEHRAINESRIEALESELAERKKGEEQLQAKVIELVAANATLQEHCRHLEKHSDRNRSFGQAALISVISMVGGALLSLLIKK